MVWLIVSPVASAAVMIAVPSISPTTISALRPGRRRTFLTPRRRKTRLRSARASDGAQDHREHEPEHDCECVDRNPEQLAHDTLLVRR